MRKIILSAIAGVIGICPAICQDKAIDMYKPSQKGELVNHTYFSLDYSEANEQAFWVFYRLTPDFFQSDMERSEDYREDPSVPSGSAKLADYKGSGYDRGHLCPAADMRLNDLSNSESFFLSNMSPQNPSFNRGIWNKLESKVREFCLREDTLFIATGPVFRDNKGTIGSDSVTIPGYFYKAIYDPTGVKKMIAFVIPNEKRSDDLSAFVVSIDSLEKLTGIDFFPSLPEDIGSKLEKEADILQWELNSDSTTTVKIQNTGQPSFTISPNPATDFIRISNINKDDNVIIRNISGKVIMQRTIIEGEEIPIAFLEKGFYFATLTNAKGVTFTKSFIK